MTLVTEPHILQKSPFTHTTTTMRTIVHFLAVQYFTSLDLLNPSLEAAHKHAPRRVVRGLERCGV